MANKQDYLDRLDHINGSSFDFIKNLNNIVISGGYYEFPQGTDLSVISWYSGRAENSELQTWEWGWQVFPNSNAYLKSSKDNTADNIYITSSGNQYSVEINCPIIAANMDYLILIPGYNGNTDGHRWNAGFFMSNGAWLSGGGMHGNPVAHWNTLSKTGTLDEIFTFLEHWCKNINIYVDGEFWDGPVPPPIVSITSNGGGATHIAKVTGPLKDLSSNLSDILMVSGGGGGGLIVGDTIYNGADAGGISGSGSNSGNQSTGYAFGQGESGANKSGGGSGLYGGYKSIK